MSWFDTSGLANIAKSALKEAQRTIDKALDIKEDDIAHVPVNTPVDTNSDDFFGSWGLAPVNDKVFRKQKSEEIVTKSPLKTSTSIWGSFTGSFFEPPTKTKDSVDSLDDSVDMVTESFSSSKLVVQPMDESEPSLSRLSSMDKSESSSNLDSSIQLSSGHVKRRDRPVNNYNNRLSIVSCESGKNSSESVEIVTESTTSPDSEALSIGQCVSTSSSILGSKQNSDSVEVILDSLTSPSSVEVLGSSSTCSRRQSQYTDEFVSPLQSPDEKFSVSEKDTPDSVEVIPDDQEENSIAEDTISYTSISESTSATVLENVLNLHLKSQKNFVRTDTVNGGSLSELSPDKSCEPVTRAPSRGGMHLPIAPAHLIDTQPQSSKADMLGLLKNSNVIDIPQESELQEDESIDEGFQSDKTIVAEGLMESSSDTSTTTDSNTNSIYLKHMLADAMTENKMEVSNSTQASYLDLSLTMIDSSQKSEIENISISELEMPPRETSPISSESRSDLVKIGSSGHTSGDELETTTSSDIEIISSPNGDSSSTHSRHSPAKLLYKPKLETNVDALLGKMTMKKMKGHNRELSEASSVSDDSELERLIKRLAEVTEILESREAKLIEISRRNAELQEINNDYRQQLDIVFNNQLDPADLHQVTEEYTQRLSALERKFQQAIRDKDILRKQLEQTKQEAISKISKGEIEKTLSEKDETIKELREEGEKLSKQQLQHSTIIKKLRAKEKENETSIKHLKEKIDELSSETDRLKRSLAAKEEVERSQIEAVHQLTEKNKKLENELHQVRDVCDDVTHKFETTKKSLDAAKKEVVDKNKTSSELLAREQLVQSLETEKQMLELQNEDVINQLEDLRMKLRQVDQDMLRKEQHLRSENNELFRRLEDAERRNEELSQSVLEVSRPLVLQLETLQATHNKKVTNLEKVEQGLSLKLNETQSKLQSLKDSEKMLKEECIGLRSKVSNFEAQLSTALHESEINKMDIEQQKTECMIKEQDTKREMDLLDQNIKAANNTIESLRKELQNVLLEKSEMEKQKDREKLEAIGAAGGLNSSPNTRTTSPTLSLGRVSLSESLGSSFWPVDESFEVNTTGRCANMLEMQLLQSNLKNRDGEVQQLQWELNRREHERTLLNTEISKLLSRVEHLEEKMSNHEALQGQFDDLQQKYDTLCQLYGEKVEETEELKLDLQDVKEMYKSQIDELLRQQKNAT